MNIVKPLLRAIFALSIGLNILLVYGDLRPRPDLTQSRYASLKNAYFVRAHQHGYFIIEHDGHRFTAKCRASLSWLDGTDQPSKPMTDGDCTYMSSTVGKSIGDDLMRHENNTLVYSPWTGFDTVQTADILTIVKDQHIK